jgi:membrane protein required for colicin V production
MQGYDLLMIIVLVAAVVWGAWKGFAWQVASLASLVASYVVAITFRQQGSQLVSRFIDAAPPWNMFLAMLILFLGTSLVVWLGFNLVAEFIEKVKLKEFDRQVGALFGLGKGVLLCVLITLFAVTLLSEPQRQAICTSRSGYYIAVLLDHAHAVIPGEVHDVLGPYIDRFDSQVDHPHTGHQRLPDSSWNAKDDIHKFEGPEFTARRTDAVMEAQPSGHSIDFSRVTPPLIIQEEEEASLGIEPEPTGGVIKTQPAGHSFNFGGVTPRIVIQEEDEAKLGIELEP